MQFVPFGSFLLRHLDKKYGVEKKPLMLFWCSSCVVHESVSNSFKDGSKAELQNKQWFVVKSSSVGSQTLVVIYNEGGNTRDWQDWLKPLLLHPDWSIKIADVTIADLPQKKGNSADGGCYKGCYKQLYSEAVEQERDRDLTKELFDHTWACACSQGFCLVRGVSFLFFWKINL